MKKNSLLSALRATMLCTLGGFAGLTAQAQVLPTEPGALLFSSQAQSPAPEVPAAPQSEAAPAPDVAGGATANPDPQAGTRASLQGSVTDSSGATVPGAVVMLQKADSNWQRILTTGTDGAFAFANLEAGSFTIVVRARGFATWTSDLITLAAGEARQLSGVRLRVATTADVEVFSSPSEIAQEQIHLEEKQRILGIVPNFYTSYVWNAAPLTTKQKFGLAIRSEIDPVSFLGAAFGAGLEQWRNDYAGYHQGAAGYAKRFGASYTDGFDGAMIGSAILPSVFHQDPRYYWKGTGTTRQRALYALSTVVICKGDNGKWETNYSNIIGNFAAGGLSNLYYPPANRGVQLTIVNATLGFAAEAVGDLFQEFLLRKISTGVQP